ncbi:LacI family DNA-binding transcriptional regulator [Phycicoccus sp. CSK15P-2]|uniref:LacI family DNA-binding transcriptional regulator n=1 Tax=Phycicoccus sp. CSK15P-2 TaxID=2807627 RepID=UPI00194F25EA|nr:LacI family DNA-binding transcriptional regulator [Phycicoccus sp. CSK15P-2]MBM6403209.1 LacI family DNA-binding transcriptional regulator [Phycicoccus sp. CSK15P-2]
MTRRLADVAARAGVSEATVSRVLNGKPGVADETRSAVLSALDVLGYERPSKLRGERARLVGLVLPELQNPIFPALADVIGSHLAQHGLTPVLCTQTLGGVTESDYIDLLLEQQVAGVIFAGGDYAMADMPHEHYARLTRRRLPVVTLNASIEGLPFARVVCDDDVAAEQAMEHLISLGHKRIGFVLGAEQHIPTRRKLAAARRWGAARHVPVDDLLVEYSDFTQQSGQAAAARAIANGATGILCASDPLALGAIRAARRAGLEVPRDISVVGYDDSAFMAAVDPPLTTIRQPIEAMGRAAVTTLVARMAGTHTATDELLYEPELVVRRSTAPRP